MIDDMQLRAALRRLHRTHNMLTRDEAQGLAHLFGIAANEGLLE